MNVALSLVLLVAGIMVFGAVFVVPTRIGRAHAVAGYAPREQRRRGADSAVRADRATAATTYDASPHAPTESATGSLRFSAFLDGPGPTLWSGSAELSEDAGARRAPVTDDQRFGSADAAGDELRAAAAPWFAEVAVHADDRRSSDPGFAPRLRSSGEEETPDGGNGDGADVDAWAPKGDDRGSDAVTTTLPLEATTPHEDTVADLDAPVRRTIVVDGQVRDGMPFDRTDTPQSLLPSENLVDIVRSADLASSVHAAYELRLRLGGAALHEILRAALPAERALSVARSLPPESPFAKYS